MLSVEVLLAADPVHDLQVRGPCGRRRAMKRMKSRASWSKPSVCRAQRREGRVADPAVAVVPVAFAAGRLRQRGGRRGDDRPGRRVGEALEDQRRALQVDPPGVVGEVAVAQPVAPELFGRVEPLERLGGAARPAEVARRPRSRRRSRSRPRAGWSVPRTAPSSRSRAPCRWSAAARVPSAPLRRPPRPARRRSSSPARRRRRSAAGTPSRARPRRRCRSSSAAASGRTRVRWRGRVLAVAAGCTHSPIVSASWTTDPAGVGDPGRLDHQRAGLVAAADRDDDARAAPG